MISDKERLEELISQGYKTIEELADEISPNRPKAIYSTMEDRLIKIREELGSKPVIIGDRSYYPPKELVRMKEEYIRKWG